MLEYEMDLSPLSETHLPAGDAARAFPFRVTEAGYFDAGPHYFTRRDGKDEALLMLTHAGRGELKWQGQSCVLEPGSCVLIFCDTYHEYRTKPGGRWEFSWLHAVGDGFWGYRPALTARLTPVRLRAPDAAREHFERVFRFAPHRDVVAMAEISDAVSSLLTDMLRSLAEGDETPLGRADIRGLASYIRQNCAENLSMDDFAREIALSQYHLIRLFTHQMGMPPYRYLHVCRVTDAQRLLRTTDRSVSEIAFCVGYSDPVNFIRHFRAIAGTTPARYRAESTKLPEGGTPDAPPVPGASANPAPGR
jgi:AraC-like DNA-binding protein